MAPIPPPRSLTVEAIYAAYKASNEHYDSLGLSVGELGNKCDRYLYYTLHWASQPEDIDGRKIRIFRRGDIEEDRLVEDLRNIGVEVWGQQERIRLVSGHVRGKIDGRGLGFPEAPKTEHLLEFKSSNRKNFIPLKKKGMQECKPLHYVQCQLGMHMLGLSRAFYFVTNKDDEDIYPERIDYDVEFCLRTLARAERIIRATEPPPRISDKPDFFACTWCKHHAVCHEQELPRVTCRSCIHATPEFGGDCHWSCARWNKPLSVDEQKAGCGAHIYDPALVPFEQIDSDAEAETITYRLPDGSTWVDGGNLEDAA